MKLRLSNKTDRILMGLLFFFLLVACSDDFLDISPEDRIAKESFFQTESDLDAAVIGIYVAERDLYAGGELGLYNIEETRSDNTNQKDGRQSEHRAVDNFTAFGGNTSYTQSWAFSYNVINLANAVIDRAPEVEMDSDRKNELIGEARFIRANTYFKLVQDYGGVPLRLEETLDLGSDNELTRSPIDSVYMAIEKDLQFSGENLPETRSGDDKGRAISAAAWGLLGKAYLQQGKNQDAIEAFEKINPDQFNLLSDYSNLWEPGNKNNEEIVYEIQFQPPKSGAPYWNAFAPASLGVPGGTNGSVSPNTPTLDLINAYEDGDLRKTASIDFTANGKPFIIKFRDPSVSVGNDADTNFPVIRYADILLMLAEAKGESQEAYNLINKVRNRAGLPNISSSSPGSFSDKVMHERQVELAFEMHRMHDIQRMETQKAIELMNNHLKREYPNSDFSFDEHDLLNPIPTTEIQSNPKIEQNQGY